MRYEKRAIVLILIISLMITLFNPINDVKASTDKKITIDINLAQVVKAGIETKRLPKAEPSIEHYELANVNLQAPKGNRLYYDLNDMRIKSNMSIAAVNMLLDGTPIRKLAQCLVEYEDIYNVNLIYVVSIIILESGWGMSERANNGSNNLTGHSVFWDDSPGTYFDSWEHCVEETFRLLSEDYLSENGAYFNGYTLYAVNQKYCTTSTWYEMVTEIVYQLDRWNLEDIESGVFGN